MHFFLARASYVLQRNTMMPTYPCDVIGCHALAEWRHTMLCPAALNEYLCKAHFEELVCQHPHLHVYYVPLSASEQDRVAGPPVKCRPTAYRTGRPAASGKHRPENAN